MAVDELLSSNGSVVQPTPEALEKRPVDTVHIDAEPFLANTEALLASHHADLMRDALLLDGNSASRAAGVQKHWPQKAGLNGSPTGASRASEKETDVLPVPTMPLRVKPPLHPGAHQKRAAAPIMAKEQSIDEKKALSIGRSATSAEDSSQLRMRASARSVALDVPLYTPDWRMLSFITN